MSSQWEEMLKDRLPLYGHRNWIVIADSAYPAQSSDGVETIVADGEQTAVLARTFALLGECRHIKPTIYTDQELNFVSEADAPGVTAYRGQLEQILKGQDMRVLPHDEIISKAGQRRSDVSRAFDQDQHVHPVYFGVFRTGVRILERRGRETPSCGNAKRRMENGRSPSTEKRN